MLNNPWKEKIKRNNKYIVIAINSWVISVNFGNTIWHVRTAMYIVNDSMCILHTRSIWQEDTQE